jgi:hypothetical protein
MGYTRHSFVSFLTLFCAASIIGASPITALPVVGRNVFSPRQASPGFQCTYPEGWNFCNSKDDRACWLKNKDGRKFDNTTDYEDIVPEGECDGLAMIDLS